MSMIKERPNTIVTVIGSGLVDLGNGSLALSIYTTEQGSKGFTITSKAIEIIRQDLDEAEAKLEQT